MTPRILLALAGAIGATIGAFAADNAATADLEIKRISLFKNGLGYFTTATRLPDRATTVKLGQLPVASLGTFWVEYPRQLRVRGLFTSLAKTEDLVPAANVGQLLLLNVGRAVEVATSIQGMPTVKGTIISAGPLPEPQAPPNPYVMGRRPPQRNSYQPYAANPYRNPPVLVLKTAAGVVSLNPNSIVSAQFEGDDIKTMLPQTVERPGMRLELEKSAGGAEVNVSYLARGITWSPSYRIDITDRKEAMLTAKALIINEVADLDEVGIDFVTGFPHAQFADVNSPLALTQTLADYLRALTSGRSTSSRNRSHVMTQQFALRNSAVYAPPTVPLADYATGQKGAGAEDLFFYPVEDISLRRGETAYIPLFTAAVQYEHIYTWDIADALDENERYRNYRAQDGKPKPEEVWHSCRLRNSMKMPWTTAPAEFIANGRFVGQDTCYFTAPGTETTVRINRAMHVIADQAEFEVERQRNAAQFYGSRYDLVTVRGELKVQNRTDKTVPLEITKHLSGDVVSISPEAKDIPTAKGLRRVNTRHTLVWNLDVKSGQEQDLTYKYRVYIRN